VGKLLVAGEWYEAVLPGSLFEADFERLLVGHAASLYPDFYLVPFKKQVESPYGAAIADLALIDRRFRDWWVVEVELAVHSLRDHVEPQVSILSTASYGSDEADYLVRKAPHLEAKAVRHMMLGLPPRILVLVNQARPEWVPSLRAWDAALGVVEVFRSQRNDEILRVNGMHPESMGDLVSVCRVDEALRNSLVVASPASLAVPHGGSVSIRFGGAVSQWRRVDIADRVWLMPVGRFPLPTAARFLRLTMSDKGELTLKMRPGRARSRQ
jgi:hypothetical protein